jgi:hypothetical protein
VLDEPPEEAFQKTGARYKGTKAAREDDGPRKSKRAKR